MAKYNGHRSWNAWNVALWLNNDEGLYRMMKDYISQHKTKARAAHCRRYSGMDRKRLRIMGGRHGFRCNPPP